MAPAEQPQKRKKRSTQDMLEENRGPGLIVTAGRTLLGFLIVAAVLAGIFFGAAAIQGDHDTALAPWTDKGAPQVTPAPLVDQ